MSSRIKTIEDLMKVSGTAAAELKKPQKPQKPKKPKKPKPSKPPKAPIKPKPTKKIDGPYVPVIPAHIDIEGLRNTPMVVHGHHRALSRKQIIKKIEEAPAREEKFSKFYYDGVAQRENNYGYLIAAVNTKREAEMLEKYLKELEHES